VLKNRAYIGIGSNLNDPVAQVQRALTALATLAHCSLESASSLYTNPPMGPQDQPDYVNAVAALDTGLTAQQLLQALLGVEQQFGRERDKAEHWGPRVIDLDLLVFGDEQIDEPNLKVPHSGIPERNFVLLPLAEIAPELNIPGQGVVADLARGFDSSELQIVSN